jgi:hypothetical protein
VLPYEAVAAAAAVVTDVRLRIMLLTEKAAVILPAPTEHRAVAVAVALGHKLELVVTARVTHRTALQAQPSAAELAVLAVVSVTNPATVFPQLATHITVEQAEHLV